MYKLVNTLSVASGFPLLKHNVCQLHGLRKRLGELKPVNLAALKLERLSVLKQGCLSFVTSLAVAIIHSGVNKMLFTYRLPLLLLWKINI